MEPTEAQFLVFNALETLAIVLYSFYDPSSGIWYIETPEIFLGALSF